MTVRISTVSLAGGALLGVGLLAACAGSPPPTPEAGPAAAAHPLAGQVWDARQGSFVDEAALIDEAVTVDHVLLGEVHVNPYHHEAQARVLAAIVARGRRPAVVFEMMDRDQQPAIDELRRAGQPDADEIAAATGFSERGWDWPQYAPLVELALVETLPILAGNAPAAETRRIVAEGSDTVGPERKAALGLVTPLEPAAHTALVQIMVDSHCGHALGDLAERLVEAQRLRDATMADVMLGAGPGGTVLITGSGHARRDHGVPLYLSARRPDDRILTVRLIEVVEGEEDPTAYRDRLAGLPRPFDYLWFTPAIDREDPCEQFREGLERLRERG